MLSRGEIVPSTSKWFPEVDNREVACILFGLGLVGAIAELASGVFAPRFALYLIVLAAGALGLVRRGRAARRRDASSRAALGPD